MVIRTIQPNVTHTHSSKAPERIIGEWHEINCFAKIGDTHLRARANKARCNYPRDEGNREMCSISKLIKRR